MSEQNTIRWERDDDGVVILTLDDPNQSANTMNEAYVASMGAAVDRLEAEREQITGVVITSAKKTFFAGGDLNDLLRADTAHSEELLAGLGTIKGQLRRLETLGRPVVAAINGSALGGGLEITMATHHRIVVDDPKIELGQPEVQLGLLPGAGGVARSVRKLGIVDALMQVLMQGTRHRPGKAKEIGLVDEVVATPEELLPAAKAWIAANPEAVQPWDVKGYKIPGGTPVDTGARPEPARVPGQPAQAAEGRQLPRPAPHHGRRRRGGAGRLRQRAGDRGPLLRRPRHRPGGQEHDPGVLLRPAAGEWRPRPPGGPRDVPGQEGRRARRRHDGRGDRLRVRQGRHRGRAQGRLPGGGRPGQGVFAGPRRQGALARSHHAGEGRRAARPDHGDRRPGRRGRRRSRHRGRLRGPGDQGAGVRRDRAASRRRTRCSARTPRRCRSPAWPKACRRPADFIGLHFFSPVDKMPLLEIIKGEQTSEETLYRALDLARQIKKTPIVVNDSRGFFTSRVIGTFINEGIAMLTEGVPAPSIEQASSQAGYPAPVLQLSDELNLKLMRKIRDAAKAAQASGDRLGLPPVRAGHRPHARRVRPPGQARGQGLLRVRATASAPACGAACKDAFGGRQPRDPVRGPQGADAVHRGDRVGQVPGREGDRVRRRRQHRLDLRHRLPGLDRRRAAVHQRLRRRPARIRGPRPRARRDATASASTRRPRSSRRPSAARPTATSARSSRPRRAGERLAPPGRRPRRPGPRRLTPGAPSACGARSTPRSRARNPATRPDHWAGSVASSDGGFRRRPRRRRGAGPVCPCRGGAGTRSCRRPTPRRPTPPGRSRPRSRRCAGRRAPIP